MKSIAYIFALFCASSTLITAQVQAQSTAQVEDLSVYNHVVLYFNGNPQTATWNDVIQAKPFVKSGDEIDVHGKVVRSVTDITEYNGTASITGANKEVITFTFANKKELMTKLNTADNKALLQNGGIIQLGKLNFKDSKSKTYTRVSDMVILVAATK